MTSTFPPCGPDCLKAKQLEALKTAMDSDPSNTQAQTAYYTALNGQGWLRTQKEDAALKEVEPVLSKYRDEYDTIASQLQAQGQFSSLAAAVKSDGGTPFLVKDYEADKSKADVLNRLWTLSGTPQANFNLEGLVLNILIFLLAAAAVWLGFVKYRAHTSPPVPSILGGNRLRTK